MFCSKCGNKLPDKSIYCNKCGAKVLDETIKKIYNDSIADQSYVKKKTQVWENVVLAFKNIINYIKKYVKNYKNSKQGERGKIHITVICIIVIIISIMVGIECLNGMHLLQVI